MTQANLLSVDELVHELDTGRATVKFILDRFSPLLGQGTDTSRYPADILPVLIEIRDLMASGLLPSQIQEMLEKSQSPLTSPARSSDDIRLSPDALGMIQGLFQEICAHQDRVARAHEKRAEVEERKALAIEKRAEAEEKKAAAMNNIAMALQEMNQLRAVDAQSMEIAGQTARALTMNEAPEADTENGPDVLTDLDSLLDHPDPGSSPMPASGPENGDPGIPDLEPAHRSEPVTTDLDDLSELVDEPGLSPRDLDDLSSLIDTVSSGADTDDLAEPDAPPAMPGLDDLAKLVDEAAVKDPSDVDDLYALVDDHPSGTGREPSSDLDDLSLLLDEGGKETAGAEDIDDLYALVSESSPPPEDDLWSLVDEKGYPSDDAVTDMDDLSLLVETSKTPAPADQPMDDLWSLVEQQNGAGDEHTEPGDDLTALVDSSPEPASLKPDITPEQDMARYKAAVMQIIIELKSSGMSPGETTDRLNTDEVPTLSGKPQWRESAIAKIYGFIDSAT